jgi:hypothetical protein
MESPMRIHVCVEAVRMAPHLAPIQTHPSYLASPLTDTRVCVRVCQVDAKKLKDKKLKTSIKRSDAKVSRARQRRQLRLRWRMMWSVVSLAAVVVEVAAV